MIRSNKFSAVLSVSIVALTCFGVQKQACSEPLSIRFPIVTRQPAINNRMIGYHYYTDYNSRGLSNWRHVPPHNLMVYGD